MNCYIQETDPRIVLPTPLLADYEELADYEDGTYGGRADLRPLPLPLLRPAWKVVRQIKDENIADEARSILSIIEETILTFQSRGVDFGHLPDLRAFDVQDGSMLIEWIFDDFRVGFSIEPASDESSWYLVSNSKLGEISASGYVSQGDPENISLILWLLNFVISHS